MGRRRLVVANWKMNLTTPEGCSLVEAVLGTAKQRPEVDVVVCPSFVSLQPLGRSLAHTPVALGAQDVFWLGKGAYTGQVSPRMLVDSGCRYCIVGHSEARGRFGSEPPRPLSYFSDTDETVAQKVSALVFANIVPILCVGETALERQDGRTDEVVAEQLAKALERVAPEECSNLTIAYEPVWAIGTGNVCDADEAARMCGLIRDEVASITDSACGDQVRILYGGSVKASNCAEIFANSQVDGALVGGASLIADEFSKIVLSA
ncbi:MAG: triose-phosphate isomerase [Armatimonadetes bacterium]|nr:triose-phosphate isomerase [Armatimonadota bacterium]